MTESDKLALAKRTLAQIADRVTEYVLGEQSQKGATMALVIIREQAQDALGELMQEDEPAPKSLGTYHGPDSP